MSETLQEQEVLVNESNPQLSQANTEDKVLEEALNDLKTSYNELTNMLTKMNGTAVRKVFMAAVSYPLDNEILQKISKRQEDVELFTHARACMMASGLINGIMMRRNEEQLKTQEGAKEEKV